MKIKKAATAGSLESSDILITVKEGNGLNIEIESSVMKLFGRQIKETILSVFDEMGVKDADIKVVDKGALNYTIISRTKSVIYRACEETKYDWSKQWEID